LTPPPQTRTSFTPPRFDAFFERGFFSAPSGRGKEKGSLPRFEVLAFCELFEVDFLEGMFAAPVVFTTRSDGVALLTARRRLSESGIQRHRPHVYITVRKCFGLSV
jgi:hypothetical protein